MGKKKLISFMLAMVLLMATLSGCTVDGEGKDTSSNPDTGVSSDNGDAKKESDKKIKVGFANINEKGSFGKMVRDSVEKEAEKRGYELICVDNNSDGATAVKNADDLLNMGIEYFIEFNVDDTVAPVIMEKMNAANVPVVAVDIAHPGAYFFGADNSEAGKIAGRAAAQYIKEKWNGEIDYVVRGIQPISGPVTAPRVMDFTVGMEEEGLIIPADKIIEIDTQNDAQISQQRMNDFLMAHPDAKRIAVVAMNDVLGAGIWAAVETAGRQDNVILYSHNSTADFVEPLYATKGMTGWIGSVGYFPERYGEWILPIIDELVEGKTPPEKSYIDHELVTWENITEHYPEDNFPWSKFMIDKK